MCRVGLRHAVGEVIAPSKCQNKDACVPKCAISKLLSLADYEYSTLVQFKVWLNRIMGSLNIIMDGPSHLTKGEI